MKQKIKINQYKIRLRWGNFTQFKSKNTKNSKKKKKMHIQNSTNYKMFRKFSKSQKNHYFKYLNNTLYRIKNKKSEDYLYKIVISD